MSDRPIIFSGPMVKAIINGAKTQTRRVLKPQPDNSLPIGGCDFVVLPNEPGRWCWLNGFDGSIISPFLVPYHPGDRLWVREAWNITHRQHLAPGEDIERSAEDCVAANGGFACACADGVVYQATAAQSHPEYGKALWRPSIHMPRWSSRLTLIVEDVLVQRLQEINRGDAMAEGCPFANMADGPNPRDWFIDLWNSINQRGYGWNVNPWVVALTFRAIQKNIDEVNGDE